MYFDSLVMCAVRKELATNLTGGRIDKIFQPSDTSLALLVRAGGQNHQLLVSAHAQNARVHLVTAWRLTSGFETPSGFVMLLRKYCEGARIVGVEQPKHERVLHITLQPPLGGAARTGMLPVVLIIEAMGRRSNILLRDSSGTVLGLWKRVTPLMSRDRPIQVHDAYRDPPQPVISEGALRGGPKMNPSALDAESLSGAFDGASGAVWKTLVGVVAGMSPLAAKEITYRALGAVNAPSSLLLETERASAVADAARVLFGSCAAGDGKPYLVVSEGRPIAFAPYRPLHIETSAIVQPLTSISFAVDRYFAGREQSGSLVAQQRTLIGTLKASKSKLSALTTSLTREIESAKIDLALREQGELLMAYQPQTRGHNEVELPNHDGTPVTIAVQPLQTATVNAQRLFKRYRKARTALSILPDRLLSAETDLAFLAQAETDVMLAETRDELKELQGDLRGMVGNESRHKAIPSQGRAEKRGQASSKKTSKQQAPIPPLKATMGGFPVLIGRNSRQNDEVTFKLASRQDLWLHARKAPGAHVVVRRMGGSEVPETVIEAAASAAAYYSGNRDATTVAVDVTEVAKVRRMRGGKPGMVVYTDERTLSARPAAPSTEPAP